MSSDVSQKPDSSPNTPNTSSQSSKQNSSPPNDQGNTINQSSGGMPILKTVIKNDTISDINLNTGNTIRVGRGGMSQRRGGSSSGTYNPNINVTGNDVQQGESITFFQCRSEMSVFISDKEFCGCYSKQCIHI